MKEKLKLIAPILFLITIYELLLNIIVSPFISSSNFSIEKVKLISNIRSGIVVLLLIAILVHAIRNKNDEKFLKVALFITKFGMIPFYYMISPLFIYNLVLRFHLASGFVTIQYIVVFMAARAIINIPSSMYGVFLNNMRYNQNIMSKKTKTILNILQFVIVVDIISTMVTLIKYKNKGNSLK